MNVAIFLILFLPFAITENIQPKINTSQIATLRNEFIKQLFEGFPFKMSITSLRNQLTSKKLEKSDKKLSGVEAELVKYYFYNREYPRRSIVINNDQSKVNPKLPVKILVHGWTEHYYVQWAKQLAAAYLTKGNYNVIVLDWSSKGDADYASASFAVPEIGNLIGNFIVRRLHRGRGIPLERIHLISHSLGAHVAGLTGQTVNKLASRKLGRITALDAAAPYFDFIILQNDDRLSADDANFVDIVHTDGGWLGFKQSLGTVDFYPNGGSAIQPGCSLLKPDVQYEDLFCSHASSHKFFTRSLTQRIKAVPCDNWDKYDQGNCGNTNSVIFGEDVPMNISGDYYLRTDDA